MKPRNRKALSYFFLVVLIFVFTSLEWGSSNDCCGMTIPTKTMQRSWECGVCTEQVSRDSHTKYVCRRVFSYSMDSISCTMAEDKCSDRTRVTECPLDNYVSCENLYMTEFQCICKPEYIGNYCKTPKPTNYGLFKLFLQAEPSLILDKLVHFFKKIQ